MYLKSKRCIYASITNVQRSTYYVTSKATLQHKTGVEMLSSVPAFNFDLHQGKLIKCLMTLGKYMLTSSIHDLCHLSRTIFQYSAFHLQINLVQSS